MFFGRKRLPHDEVQKTYPGIQLSLPIIFFKLILSKGLRITKEVYQTEMKPLSDLFSIPEATLISDVLEHFNQKQISVEGGIVYSDVTQAVRLVHMNKLHKEIMKKPHEYLEKSKELITFFDNVKQSGKKVYCFFSPVE